MRSESRKSNKMNGMDRAQIYLKSISNVKLIVDLKEASHGRFVSLYFIWLKLPQRTPSSLSGLEPTRFQCT